MSLTFALSVVYWKVFAILLTAVLSSGKKQLTDCRRCVWRTYQYRESLHFLRYAYNIYLITIYANIIAYGVLHNACCALTLLFPHQRQCLLPPQINPIRWNSCGTGWSPLSAVMQRSRWVPKRWPCWGAWLSAPKSLPSTQSPNLRSGWV